MVTVMHVPAGHSFPDATGVAFALGLGPPSLLAAIFIVHIPQSQSVFSNHVFCVISARSGSHVSSSVSVKSDCSREKAPNFREKTPSAKRYFMDFCFRKYIRECLSYS